VAAGRGLDDRFVINFRYHLVSLVAVFLALTVGITVGIAAVNGSVLPGLRAQVDGLRASGTAQQRDLQALRQRVSHDNQFTAAVSARLVAGKLAGRTVILVSTDNVPAQLADAVRHTLGESGAKVSGRVQLLPGYADPRRAAELTAYATSSSLPAGLQLPESDDAGLLGAALLGYVLVGRDGGRHRPAPKDTAQVLAGLASLQLLHADGDALPADLAVLLTAGQYRGTDAAGRLGAVTDLAAALDRDGGGVVVAGDLPSADTGGAVAAVRADQSMAATVSTVDSVDTAAGQVATAYALSEQAAGRAGQYGVAANAEAALPTG
jgi:Copper transport outer membrane protein, MctB